MMADRPNDMAASNPESAATRIDRICDQFEQAWRNHERPQIEDYLEGVDEPLCSQLFAELLLSDLEFRAVADGIVEAGAYLTRFPARREQISEVMAQFRDEVRQRVRAGDEPVAAVRDPETTLWGTASLDRCGNYELVQEIARGGMGVVFKAYDTKLQRTVALKMILDRNLASTEAVKRFYAEAETAAGLNHPGIVPVYEVGSHGGHHYYSMGYVEGPTLSEELRRRRFSMPEAARLVLELAHAVAYAHEHGVVHRDLKPGNILLGPEGLPQITDFGLAKRTDRPSELTMDGQILGTPGYMAPEQAAGDTDRLGPAVDVYALGAVLYHLITGHPPFRTALDALVCVLEQDPVPPRAMNRRVPRDLDVICMKCLNKSPADRYDSVKQLAADLQSYLDGELIQARPASLRRRLQRWGRHRPRLASVLVTMLAFYIYHLASLWLGNPGSQGLFHWQATGTMLFVCLYAWFFQSLLMRPRAKRYVLYAWVGTDILVFTLFTIFALQDPRSPLLAIYFCMVAGAALSFDRYLVWLVTAAAMLSYGLVVCVSRWYQPDLRSVQLREAMPFTIAMLTIGVIQYYVLRCARVQLNLGSRSD